MQKNTRDSYSFTSKFFHWTMSVIILTLLAVGLSMTRMDDSDLKWQIYAIHKSFGLIILLLLPMRLTWRLMNSRPHLDMVAPWEKQTAITVHWLLYLAMFLMPMSGWIMSTASNHTPLFFGLFEIAAPVAVNQATASVAYNTHITIAWVLMALLGLHLSGALKGHFIKKNNILKRMLPGRSKGHQDSSSEF